jgi:ribosomal 50S subunit-recycling heat shock protein
MASNGQIAVNGRAVKAAYQVQQHDIITIKGVRGRTIEVLALPTGSVPKERRSEYFKELPS